jgi:lipopolysaccharide export system ATP-binding protein
MSQSSVMASVMVLEAKNISKSYGDVSVLKNVGLKVQSGEVVALLGPNGAGKTTFFYIISGLVHADSGTILLDNTDITAWPIYDRAKVGLGYLPQEASIFRGLNVEDNILAICETIEPNLEKALAKTDSLLNEFSISHLRKSKATSLSGGERRRLEIARSLATNPKFLLLDEPFAGVDPIAVKDIRNLVQHLTQRGLGIIITDHNVRETLDIIDRGYILYNGDILISGDRETIINDERVRKFYLGEDFYYRTS